MRNVLEKVVEEIKTHTYCSVTFFRKSCGSWDNLKNLCGAGQTTDNTTLHAGYLRLPTHVQHM
jgi:hypothetical protein